MKWFHSVRTLGVWLLVGAVALATGGPAAAEWKIEYRNGGNGSSWQIVPKGSSAASTGTKSPGFGSKPGTGFYEPGNSSPQRTPAVFGSGPVKVRAPGAPSSAHERAPAVPNSSAYEKAPAVPDKQQEGLTNGGQKDPGESIYPSGKGKYPGNNGKYPGNNGKYPGQGSVWGKGHFDSLPLSMFGGGSYVPWIGSAPGVPPAPPAPSAPLFVVNPTKNGVTMPFLLNGQTTELSAGEQLELPTDRAWEIKFDHGGGFGVARYSLASGVYQFTYTDHGWELYRYAAE